MTTRRGLSLLEVLLAAAMLAMVVAACLPLLSATALGPTMHPDPRLGRIAEAQPVTVPPNVSAQRFESVVDGEIKGVWIVVTSGDRVALVWSVLDSDAAEDPP